MSNMRDVLFFFFLKRERKKEESEREGIVVIVIRHVNYIDLSAIKDTIHSFHHHLTPMP